MARVSKIEPLVREALENNPSTRNDDFLLINEVLNHFMDTNLSVKSTLNNHTTLGLPSFASIIRSRRRVQAKNEELCATKEVQEIRLKEEQKYREYEKI